MPSPQTQVLARCEENIAYYRTAARHNKRAYKVMRYLTVVLGALVTLLSSLSSAGFVQQDRRLEIAFDVLTPVLAAAMAVVAGFSQTFQWGAAWSDMEIMRTRLERERDRLSVTPAEQFDPVREMTLVDDLVLAETQGFFQRLFGSGSSAQDAVPQ
jgi:hypothetical protein